MPTTAPPPAGPPRWSITYQRQTTQPAPQGGFTQGVEVGFTTADNVSASVFIPWDKYAPEYVRQAIDGRVAQIEAVHQLQG